MTAARASSVTMALLRMIRDRTGRGRPKGDAPDSIAVAHHRTRADLDFIFERAESDMTDQRTTGPVLDREDIRAVPRIPGRRIVLDQERHRRNGVLMISIHLTRKPRATRRLIAQQEGGLGILQNEVPEKEGGRLDG
jgi:hypothetical protein